MTPTDHETDTGMDGFRRTDRLFSLCGLNCGLCGFRLQGKCDGCFQGSFCAVNCPRVPCSVRHGNLEYCFQCPEYPCRHYDGFADYDTLVLHRTQPRDMRKAKEMGIEAYLAEQRLKVGLLERLLKDYDDGTNQVFLCAAVNLLSVEDMKTIIDRADSETKDMDKAARLEHIVNELKAFADANGIRI